MALSTTVWYDKNNDRHTGYIKDGKAYVDENATTRVPIGATVETAGGTFKMTDNGGVPTAATARNQFLQGTDAAINAYKAAGRIQNDRINSATNAAIAELNRQKQIAGQNREDADRAARDAYRAAANPFGAMEEQRVRLGLDNSGYAESSKLRLASDLAAQLTANQRAMDEQLRDIDVQIAEARAQGKYELANMLEARAQNIMQNQITKQNTLYSSDMQAMNMAENTRQFNDQMALEREEIARAETRAKEENKYNLALTFLENGMDSDFVINTLGIPAEDVSAMASQIRNQRAQEAALAMAKATKSVSSGGMTASQLAKIEEKKANTQYLTDAVNAWKASGMDLDTWIGKIAKSYGITSPADIKEFRTLAGGGGGAPAPAGNGMSYSEVISKLNELKKDKNKYRDPNQAVENAIDIVDGAGLTPEQIASIKAMYADFFGI